MIQTWHAGKTAAEQQRALRSGAEKQTRSETGIKKQVSETNIYLKGDVLKMMHLLTADLRAFAGGLNTQTTGTANLSSEMKTYYDTTLIHSAEPKLVHAQFGQKRNIPQGRGKIIEFRRFSQLPKALTPLTEGVTPDGG